MASHIINDDNNQDDADRRILVQRFDNAKVGVKAIADKRSKAIPSLFIQPPFIINDLPVSNDFNLIPQIDMLAPHLEIIPRISEVVSKYGFFLISNHGIPDHLGSELITAAKNFYELPESEKEFWYGRHDTYEIGSHFHCNHDLFNSRVADWRDTLVIKLGPQPNNTIPDVCRNAVQAWFAHIRLLANRLVGLSAEGLELAPSTFSGSHFLGRVGLMAHYYPPCQVPDIVLGHGAHTDAGFITIVKTNGVMGLQLKIDGKWVNYFPYPNSLVVYIGDLLQVVSNDFYKSDEHRVVATRPSSDLNKTRVALICAFSPGNPGSYVSPHPELVKRRDGRPKYSPFFMSDYLDKYFDRELVSETVVKDYYLLGYN